jgi:hypothetical protein
MQRLWESIFGLKRGFLVGLKRGFLDQPGELSMGFNPKWPTEPLINLGPMNWLVGAAVLALLAFWVFRVRAGAAEPPAVRRRRRIGVVLGALVVLLLAGRAWGILAGVIIAPAFAAAAIYAPWHWRLWIVRLGLVAIFFSLLSGTVAFPLVARRHPGGAAGLCNRAAKPAGAEPRAGPR